MLRMIRSGPSPSSVHATVCARVCVRHSLARSIFVLVLAIACMIARMHVYWYSSVTGETKSGDFRNSLSCQTLLIQDCF